MPAKLSTAPASLSRIGVRNRKNDLSSSTISKPSNKAHVLELRVENRYLGVPMTFGCNPTLGLVA